MSHFDAIPRGAALAKYVAIDRFLADPRPDKMLLATGAYKDETGQTPHYASVRQAEERLHKRGLSRDYLDVSGYRPLCDAMEKLLLGANSNVIAERRIRTAHTPGGTASLRVAADLIHTQLPGRAVWVSDPTWGNHLQIFHAAGLQVRTYPYAVDAQGRLQYAQLIVALAGIPAGDVVLLHASTHNPTGVDPTADEWSRLAVILAERHLLPFFDAAFFGFTAGIEEDLAGLRGVIDTVGEALVATSLSKSFALYNERVGTVSVIAAKAEAAKNANSHIRALIRSNYSNPPLFGAAVVAEILNDAALFALWRDELAGVRARIDACRKRIVALLQSSGVPRELAHVTQERGLFTSLDLTDNAVEQLRTEHAIHVGSEGRINVTALTDRHLVRFCTTVSGYLK